MIYIVDLTASLGTNIFLVSHLYFGAIFPGNKIQGVFYG